MGNYIQLKDSAGNKVFPVGANAVNVESLVWDSKYDTDIIATAKNYILREKTESGTHYFYFSADCGKTWTKAANTIGVITHCHFFSNGVVLLCSNDYCYTTSDFSTFTQSSVYDYDGSAFVSNTSAHSFYSLAWQVNAYHELDGQEVLIWNDYNINNGYVSRVWMSLDYGATIRCILKNGVTQDTQGNTISVRHFHRVWLVDELGVLWVTSGDTGNECRLTKGTYANGSWTWETVGKGSQYKIGQMIVEGPNAYMVTDYTDGVNDTGLLCCPVASLNDATKFKYLYKSDNKEALSKWYEDAAGNKVILGDGAIYNALWYARGNYNFTKIPISYSTNTLALYAIIGPNYLGQVIVTYFPTGGYNNAGNLTISGQHNLLLSDLMRDAGVADFGNPGNVLDMHGYENLQNKLSEDSIKFALGYTPADEEDVNDLKEDVELVPVPVFAYKFKSSYGLDTSGNEVSATSTGAMLVTYDVEALKEYLVSGYSPGNSERLLGAFYDANGSYITGRGFKAATSGYAVDLPRTAPQNARYLKVFSAGGGTANFVNVGLKEIVPINDSVAELETDQDDIQRLTHQWKVEGVTKQYVPCPYVKSQYGSCVIGTGSIYSPSGDFSRYVTIDIDAGWDRLYFLGIITNNSTLDRGYAFLDTNNAVISASKYDVDTSLSDFTQKMYAVSIPVGAKKFRTNCVVGRVATGTPTMTEDDFYIFASLKGGDNLDKHITDVIKNGDILIPSAVNAGKAINTSGELINSTLAGAEVDEYDVSANTRYLISGRSALDGNSANGTSIVCKDAQGNRLIQIKPYNSAVFQDYLLTTPANTARLFVWGTNEQKPVVKSYPLTQDNIMIDSVPMIYNKVDYRPLKNNTLKVLCFGPSWFMDTWWYLNKLLGNAGVSNELHCYYMGHSALQEWEKLYNNDLTPFSGSEASRGASKNISINGADWTISTYSSSGSYNAQAFRNDFYNDLIAGDWDIIAIQQVSAASMTLASWEAGLGMVEIVKKNCSPRTTIALNAPWTFGLNYSTASGSYWPGISRLADGKAYVQQMNTRNAQWFMARTGIDNASPNGAMMSLMRADNTLNISNDMATDHLHPDNGLPILGLCGCFYETFIAPIIGISFSELDWLPTSSTQKASVSGTSFQSCSAAQLATLQQYVKKALANRFEYYT